MSDEMLSSIDPHDLTIPSVVTPPSQVPIIISRSEKYFVPWKANGIFKIQTGEVPVVLFFSVVKFAGNVFIFNYPCNVASFRISSFNGRANSLARDAGSLPSLTITFTSGIFITTFALPPPRPATPPDTRPLLNSDPRYPAEPAALGAKAEKGDKSATTVGLKFPIEDSIFFTSSIFSVIGFRTDPCPSIL